MIIKKNCGCEILIDRINGLSTITFIKVIKKCDNCEKIESLRAFFKDIVGEAD